MVCCPNASARRQSDSALNQETAAATAADGSLGNGQQQPATRTLCSYSQTKPSQSNPLIQLRFYAQASNPASQSKKVEVVDVLCGTQLKEILLHVVSG